MNKRIITLIVIFSIPFVIYKCHQQRKEAFTTAITGGFGTHYKDSPYPFNRPGYPVECNLKTYKVDFVNISVQQDQIHLKIPADAMGSKGARRRADSKECKPMDISLRYVFYDEKLMRSGNDQSEAKALGYKGTLPREMQQHVKIKIIDLLDSPAQAKAKADEMMQNVDPKIYSERMKMKNFPLWFYPNRDYVKQEKSNALDTAINKERKKENESLFKLEKTRKYGYGVYNSMNPLTKQPYLNWNCSIYIPNHSWYHRDTQKVREKFVTATKTHTGNSKCGGYYYVVTEDTVIKMYVTLDWPAIKNIDKIYQQLDGIIKSYIIKKPQTEINNTVQEKN